MPHSRCYWGQTYDFPLTYTVAATDTSSAGWACRYWLTLSHGRNGNRDAHPAAAGAGRRGALTGAEAGTRAAEREDRDDGSGRRAG